MIPQTTEILIVTLVLAGTGFAVLRAALKRRTSGTAEYFFAGRNVSMPVLALSLAVTTIWWIWSLFTAIPVGPSMRAWVVPAAAAVGGLVLLGLTMSPRYRDSGAITIPAFLGERYGRGVGMAVAILSIGVTLFVCVPFTIFIGSRLLSGLLGWEPLSSALLLIVATGLFVIPGGYTAVIAAHAGAGAVVALGLLLLAANGFYPGEDIVRRILPDTGTSWFPVAAGAVVVGFWFTCVDQSVFQRVIAARSCAAIRGGAALAALLVALGVLAMAAGFDVVPAGNARTIETTVAAGLVGAAIISLGIATLTGLFMSAATVFSMDILPPKSGDEAVVLAGRLANTAIVILAILAASSLSIAGEGSVQWMARAAGIALPPVAAILPLGLLLRRMNGRGAIWALVIGWLAGVVFGALSGTDVEALLQGVILTFVVSAMVCIGVSLATAAPGIPGPVAGSDLQEGLQTRKP